MDYVDAELMWISRYLIVGFVPRMVGQAKKDLKKVVGAKQGAPAGTQRPDTQDFVTSHNALIAVVKIQEMKARMASSIGYW